MSDDDKELYRVTVVVHGSPTLNVVCREYVEARGFQDAEQEALLAIDRRWGFTGEPHRYEVREVERGAFVRAT